jgi:glycosidase
MQWSNEPHGGFTSATPWLPAGDFSARNVEAQRRDPNSVWRFHKALITLRRDHPALQTGAYLEVATATDVWAFERRHDQDRVLVLLNCTRSSIAAGLQRSGAARVLSGSHRAAGQEVILENLELSPLEVLLLTA